MVREKFSKKTHGKEVWERFFGKEGKEAIDLFGRKINNNFENEDENTVVYHFLCPEMGDKYVIIDNTIPLHPESSKEMGRKLEGEVNGKKFKIAQNGESGILYIYNENIEKYELKRTYRRTSLILLL